MMQRTCRCCAIAGCVVTLLSVACLGISALQFTLAVGRLDVKPVVKGSGPAIDDPLVVDAGRCPCRCSHYTGGTAKDQECLPGRACAFGDSWCTDASHPQTGLLVKGHCNMSTCNGPAAPSYPEDELCGAPMINSVDLLGLVRGAPQAIAKAIENVEQTNAMIANGLASNGLDDLTIEVDADLVRSFELLFDGASVTWLVGCWPPQRYALISGSAKILKGQVRIQVGPVAVILSFSNFAFTFRELRFEVQCHGGQFVLGGIGAGTDAGVVEPSNLQFSGEVSVSCGRGWDPVCQSLTRKLSLVIAALMPMLPEQVAHGLAGVKDVPLAPGCPWELHNSMTLVAYNARECCEAKFGLDETQCLNGGQFNGRVPGSGAVKSVSCEEEILGGSQGVWKASCETIPGGYSKLGTSTCRENDVLPPSMTLLIHKQFEGIISAMWLGASILRLAFAFMVGLICCCGASFSTMFLRGQESASDAEESDGEESPAQE